MAILIEPDCRDGKHRNCSGDAWDTEADAYVDCPCECHKANR